MYCMCLVEMHSASPVQCNAYWSESKGLRRNTYEYRHGSVPRVKQAKSVREDEAKKKKIDTVMNWIGLKQKKKEKERKETFKETTKPLSRTSCRVKLNHFRPKVSTSKSLSCPLQHIPNLEMLRCWVASNPRNPIHCIFNAPPMDSSEALFEQRIMALMDQLGPASALSFAWLNEIQPFP